MVKILYLRWKLSSTALVYKQRGERKAGKEVKKMGITRSVLSVLLLTGTLGFSLPAMGDESAILEKLVLIDEANYCNMRFPAIEEQTLSWAHPVLQDARSSDIVDFYGPCDYDVHGKDEVQAQLAEVDDRFYEGGDD